MNEISISDLIKKNDDIYTWELYLKYFNQINISKKEKTEIINALKYFQKIFPKGFIKNYHNNRISRLLTDTTKFNRKELINIYKCLKRFENNEDNYKILLSKILNSKKSDNEGFPFLKIGCQFAKEGYQIIYEPIIINFNKKPDILVIDKKSNKLYIEVSVLKQSDIIKRRRENYSEIMNKLITSNLSFSGKILNEFNDEQMKQIKIEIDKIILKSKNQNKFINHLINNKIHIGVSSNMEKEKLIKWCNKNHYQINELISMELDFQKDAYRIANNKINKEAKQIPKGESGLIYLTTYPYFILFGNIEPARLKIQQQLNKYPNILGIIIQSNIISDLKKSKIKYKNGDYYIVKEEYGLNKKIILFVRNNNYSASSEINSKNIIKTITK